MLVISTACLLFKAGTHYCWHYCLEAQNRYGLKPNDLSIATTIRFNDIICTCEDDTLFGNEKLSQLKGISSLVVTTNLVGLNYRLWHSLYVGSTSSILNAISSNFVEDCNFWWFFVQGSTVTLHISIIIILQYSALGKKKETTIVWRTHCCAFFHYEGSILSFAALLVKLLANGTYQLMP